MRNMPEGEILNIKTGDRVVAVCNVDSRGTDCYVINKGDTGTVVDIRDGGEIYGVRWDKVFPRGYDLYGKCDTGHGWEVYTMNIAPLIFPKGTPNYDKLKGY